MIICEDQEKYYIGNYLYKIYKYIDSLEKKRYVSIV